MTTRPPLTAREIRRLAEQFSALQEWDSDTLLRSMPDDLFKDGVLLVAQLFSKLKAEAVRRGVWDELSKQKVTPT